LHDLAVAMTVTKLMPRSAARATPLPYGLADVEHFGIEKDFLSACWSARRSDCQNRKQIAATAQF